MSPAKIFLSLILLLSFALRIYLLDQIPNSISGDEAAFSYNAYSILKTGKDEFGYSFPLFFRSFDDYKNPLFGYILIPVIAVLGLNEWAIRLPSVFSGIMTVLMFFLITRKLTGRTKVSLLAAFFAGISPWLIQYSRVAIDGEIALFLTLAGLFLFLKGKERQIWYLGAFLIWSLAFYAYYSSKLWIILFGMYLLIVLRKPSRYLVFGILVFALLTIPYFYLLKTSSVGLRSYAISVFADAEKLQKDISFISSDLAIGIKTGKIIHNRRLTFINQAIDGYLRILSPDILFSQSRYNQISSTRLFYLWQLPLILLGTLLIFRNKPLFLFIFVWLFIGYIPGGLTALPIYDRRILLNSYPLVFLSAYAFYLLFMRLLKGNISRFLVSILLVCSFHAYLHNYFIHGRDEVVYLWGNGMKEVIARTIGEEEKFEKIIVSMRLNAPLTYFLFYKKYPPEKYLAEGGTFSGGFLEERNRLGKYRFEFIDTRKLEKNVLYVWGIDESSPYLTPLHTVFMSDGKPLAQIGIYK